MRATRGLTFQSTETSWCIAAATAATALGCLTENAGASVVFYELKGPVFESPHDPTLIGQEMYLRWSVDSNNIVTGAWGPHVAITQFEYGVSGTSEQWVGTGGTFSFSSYQLIVTLPTSLGSYTQQGSFDTNWASFTYWGSPPVSSWNADGLPTAFAFNYFAGSTSPFIVRNASSTELIRMNRESGVTLTAIPETGSAALLGLGALAALRRRKRGHE